MYSSLKNYDLKRIKFTLSRTKTPKGEEEYLLELYP